MSDPPILTSEKRTADVAVPDQAKPLISPKYVLIAVALVIIAVVVIVGLVIVAVRNPAHTETVRDMAIIALAAESGLIGLGLLVLVVQVARLANMLEFEIKPILLNTADTVSTVRGTASFVSERMVSPIIKASGYVSGAARLVGALRGLAPGGRGGESEEQRQDDSQQSTIGGER